MVSMPVVLKVSDIDLSYETVSVYYHDDHMNSIIILIDRLLPNIQ